MRVKIICSTLAAVLAVSAAPAFASHSDLPSKAKVPTKAKIVKAYPRLYEAAVKSDKVPQTRNFLKHGHPKNGKKDINLVYKDGLRIWKAFNPGVIKSLKIDYLDAHPSPENNKKLAKLLYPNKFWALNAIFSGESGWHHNIWNGGAIGAWPDRYPGASPTTCAVGWAYGLGQACPRHKMETWARSRGYKNPARIYDSPKLQIIWAVEGYAPQVHGSIENAASQWTAGGRNGRTW
jgi:hypothetical protein